MEKTILLVPGFQADTYSEIESALVELSNKVEGIKIVWLVPEIGNKYLIFRNPENKKKLPEPLYVSYLDRYNVEYFVANISKYNFASNWRLYHKIFSEYDVDAVFTHFGFERIWTTFFGKLFGKTTIWNEHWYSLGNRHVILKRMFYRYFVDYFISISQFISNSLPEVSNVYTVPNSITISGEEMKNNDVTPDIQLRSNIGIRDGVKVILMVASFTPQKRYDLALRICSEVIRAHKDVFFIFLGEGSERSEILQKIQSMNISEYFYIPGYVNNVNDYYRISDICILTSCNEGFGYCVVEAMKHAKPIVAFSSGALGEIIEDGVSGFLVAEGDIVSFTNRINGLVVSKHECDRIGRNGLDRVKTKFGRAEWIRSMNTALMEILSGDVRHHTRKKNDD